MAQNDTENRNAGLSFGPTVWGVPDGSVAFLLRQRLAEHDGPLLHVARDDAAVAALADMLGWLTPEVEVLKFPAWDCLPYDRASPNPSVVAERVGTLCRLLEPTRARRVVLTTVHALVQRVTPRAAFRGQSINIAAGETLDQALLVDLLVANGYTRTDTVMEPGEFAVRGGIFDLFPAGAVDPVRLDLFGDEVENIRTFDVGTQRSTEQRTRFVLRPVAEFALDAERISRFRTGWRDAFGPTATDDVLYINVSEARRHPGLEHYLPLFHDTHDQQMETLLDYLPGVAVSSDPQIGEILNGRLDMMADHYEARRLPVREGETPYRALPPHRLYLDRHGWDALFQTVPKVVLNVFAKPDLGEGVDAGGRPGPLFSRAKDGTRDGVFEAFGQQVKTWAAQGRRTYVTAWSRGSRERIAHLLQEHGVQTAQYEDWPSAAGLARGVVGLITLGLERGFVLDRLCFVSEQDLLGERIARPPRRKKRAEHFIAQIGEIAEGDLVVHQDYGIGRYAGLETITEDRVAHDYLAILYDGGQRLLLPVENIELLSRFGSEQAGVQLDRLGGTAWQDRKAKMKSRIRVMAGELIRTAAARALREAPDRKSVV